MDGTTEFLEVATAVLALIAAGGAVCIVAARALAPRWPTVGRLGARVVARREQLTLAVAGVATLGSLYFSEVADYGPCRLCWFQRIAMYPIALVALIALLRGDRDARWYIVPMAAIGAAISSYHLLVEWDVIGDSAACSLFGPPCDVVWFKTFGFVSLAVMALAGFVSIIVLNTVAFDRDAAPDPLEDS